MENIKEVEFNDTNENSITFDFVSLEELFEKKEMCHSIVEYHEVKFYLILLIEEGRGIHSIANIDYEFSKGTIYTIRKNQIHKFTKSDGVKGTLIIFTDEFMVSYLNELESNKIKHHFNEQLGSPKYQLNEMEFKGILKIKNKIKKELTR